MKFLVTAVLKVVAIVIATVLVSLITNNVMHLKFRFDEYAESGKDQVVTVASAFGIVDDGVTATAEQIEKKLKKEFYIAPPMPSFVVDLFNIRVSYDVAKFFYCYEIIMLLAGLICFYAAVGFPFALYRGMDLAVLIDDRFVSMTSPVWNERGYTYHTRGENLLTKIVLGLLMYIVCAIIGMLLPFTIVFDILAQLGVLVYKLIKKLTSKGV